MELTLNVDSGLARKIQGLSILTGKTAGEITGDLSSVIETEINRGILLALNLNPKDLIESIGTGSPSLPTNTITETFPSKPYEENYSQETEKENFIEDEIEDEISMVEGLGVEDSKFDEFDVSLPSEENKSELIMPGNEEDTEEIMMPIKDKDGNDVGYDDSVMSELQRELENGDLDGMSDSDYDEDEDEVEVSNSPVRRARVSTIGDDTPKGAEGYVPDILPIDFGINNVSTEDGQQSGGAMNFFNNAFEGTQGNKSARNTVKRKTIITDF